MTHAIPQWLIDKNAARAPALAPILAPAHTVHAKPARVTVLLDTAYDIEAFELDAPSFENHSDDCSEGLDTLDLSFSQE